MENQDVVVSDAQEQAPSETTQTNSNVESEIVATEPNATAEAVAETTERSAGYDKRIAKLTAEKLRERELREQAQKELDFYKHQASYASQPVSVSDSELRKPSRNDYSDPAEYAEAMIDYRLKLSKVEEAKQIEQAKRAFQTQQVNQQIESYKLNYQQQVQDFVKDVPDFNETIDKLSFLNEAHALAIQMSDEPVKLAYYLGKNIDEALDLKNAKNPVDMGIKIGILTERMKSKGGHKTAQPLQSLNAGQSANLKNSVSDEDRITRLRREKFKGRRG